LYLQTFCVAVHAPATHDSPLAQSLVELHGHGPLLPPHAWQWFATHALPLPQSAFELQPFGVHAPATQTSPAFLQSLCCAHGHAGWPLPPHAWQPLFTHALPAPQSAFVEHSFGVPASCPGGAQSPAWQTVPRAQSESDWHVCSHPELVHTDPVGQLELPVHGCGFPGLTGEQP